MPPGLPLIDGGQTYNARFLPDKYKDDKYNTFFNFELKHFGIVSRMIYLNDKIKILWSETKLLIDEPSIDTSTALSVIETTQKHQIWQKTLINSQYSKEEFIAGLSKVVKDCLTLYSVAKQKFRKNNNPPESIGQYLNNEIELKEFDDHKYFLELLNNLDNADKHSIIDCQFEGFDREPSISVIRLRDDESHKFNYKAKPIKIFLDDLVKRFNEFYQFFDSLIKS